jgi:hypothetical protein
MQHLSERPTRCPEILSRPSEALSISKGPARGALWLHALTLDTPSLLAGTQEVNLLVRTREKAGLASVSPPPRLAD